MREELWAEWLDVAGWVDAQARRYAERDIELEDLLRDAAMDRFESVHDEWDEFAGPSRAAWVRYKLRFIMAKRVGAFRRRKRRAHAGPVPDRGRAVDAGLSLEVRTILEAVTPLSAWLLYAHDCLGMTFQEMGDAMGVSRNTASARYRAALEEARCASGVRA